MVIALEAITNSLNIIWQNPCQDIHISEDVYTLCFKSSSSTVLEKRITYTKLSHVHWEPLIHFCVSISHCLPLSFCHIVWDWGNPDRASSCFLTCRPVLSLDQIPRIYLLLSLCSRLGKPYSPSKAKRDPSIPCKTDTYVPSLLVLPCQETCMVLIKLPTVRLLNTQINWGSMQCTMTSVMGEIQG